MVSRTKIWISFIVLGILMGLMRLHTFDEPLERDIIAYAVLGNEFLEGRSFYSEMWSNRSPLIYLTHAAAQGVTGYGPGSIYLLGLLAALVTMAGIYRCASSGGAGRTVGLWAAVFWTLVSCDAMLQANQPNTEVFINACLVWALALLLADSGEGRGTRRALGIGALFALATFYKQIAVVPAAGLALAHILFPAGGAQGRRRALRQVGVIAGVGMMAWASFFLYFYVTGRFEYVWNSIIVYNRHYSGSIGWNVLRGLNPDRLLPMFMASIYPLVAIAVLGAALGDRKNPSREGMLLLAYALSVGLMVMLPGKFFPHYYQYWLPVLVIVAGRALGTIGKRTVMEARRVLNSLGTGTAALLLALQMPFFDLKPEQWSQLKYGGIFVETRRVAREIDSLLLPNETLYNWGFDVGLYFYSRTRPPTGLIWDFMVIPPDSRLSDGVIKDVAASPPELLVVSPRMPPSHPILNWFLERYDPFPGKDLSSVFKVYVRRDGALAARLRAG